MNTPTPPDGSPPAPAGDLTLRRERVLLLILAGVLFTHILDFMTITPLGPVFIAAFGLSEAQFAALVSAYSLAAAASGLLASTYVDRFDRKRLLLTIYALFAVTLLACAAAPGFGALLAGRVAAGIFGGLLNGLVQTIAADAVPFERRGRATGTLMAAFSVATVAGVPLGLTLATWLGWRAPFVASFVAVALLWVLAARNLPTLDAHLSLGVPSARASLARSAGMLADANLRRAFLLTATLMGASFAIIPFITIYATANIGVPLHQLPWLYLCGGLATFFTAPLFGRLADRYGKRRVFTWITVAAMVPLMLITVLPAAPLWVVLIVSTLFFVLVSGRNIPGMALLSAAVPSPIRGTFMTLNASVQQAAMGLSAAASGWLLTRDDDGRLLRFGWVGLAAVVLSLLAVWLARRLQLAGAHGVDDGPRPAP